MTPLRLSKSPTSLDGESVTMTTPSNCGSATFTQGISLGSLKHLSILSSL